MYGYLKLKSVWNLSLSREKTSAILSLLTTCLFQISLANIGTGELKLLFYPQNAWKVLSKPGRNWWFRPHVSANENSPFIMEGRHFLQYKRIFGVHNLLLPKRNKPAHIPFTHMHIQTQQVKFPCLAVLAIFPKDLSPFIIDKLFVSLTGNLFHWLHSLLFLSLLSFFSSLPLNTWSACCSWPVHKSNGVYNGVSCSFCSCTSMHVCCFNWKK